jgi:transposase InsO family protein
MTTRNFVLYITNLPFSSGHTNALAESVNALYKKELISRGGPWNDVSEVTLATAEWVYWFNNVRLHSWCGDVPPLEFEQSYWQRPPMAA